MKMKMNNELKEYLEKRINKIVGDSPVEFCSCGEGDLYDIFGNKKQEIINDLMNLIQEIIDSAYDRGRANERADVVAWLGAHRYEIIDPGALADAVERGDHQPHNDKVKC